jgi:hypothetical protein
MRGGELKGVAIYPTEENEDSTAMGFVEGDEQSITRLARDCMYLARASGSGFCSAVVPTRYYARLIERGGYPRKESVGQVVLEHKGKGFHIPRRGKAR